MFRAAQHDVHDGVFSVKLFYAPVAKLPKEEVQNMYVTTYESVKYLLFVQTL